MVTRAGCAALGGVILVVAGCGSATPPVSANRTLPPATQPVIAALAVTPQGVVRYGDLATGQIRDRGTARVLARVPVKSGGQRGLLGLAIDQGGRTFGAAIEPGGRLVVDQVLPAPRRRV